MFHPKRLIVRFAVALLAALLTQYQADASERKSILFVNPGFADKGFWHAVSSTMRAAADSFGYDLTIVSADRKWPVMVSRGLDAIKHQSPDFLILVNEHQQAPRLVEAADKKGIPTLLLLNTLTEEQIAKHGKPREGWKNWLGSLTPDNVVAGYQMVNSLSERGEQLGLGHLKLLTLAGDFKTPASIDRLAGLDSRLDELTGITELRRITVNWSEEEAYRRTSLFLKSNDVNAVWAANDPIAFGAIRALREKGLEPGRDAVVAGLNWSTEAVDLVRTEKMTLTHGGHFLAGAWVIVLINDYDHGRDFGRLTSHVKFPMSAITSRNADTYASVFGTQDWTRIDFAAFSMIGKPEAAGYEFTLDRLLSSVRTGQKQ